MARVTLHVRSFGDTPFGMFGKVTMFRGSIPLDLGTIYSIERSWHNNYQDISCIPEGEYAAKVGTFKGKYRNLELQDVPGRSNIEVHVANRAVELRGCIAVGDTLGSVGNEWAVYNSTLTLETIMAQIEDSDKVTVVIRRA